MKNNLFICLFIIYNLSINLKAQENYTMKKSFTVTDKDQVEITTQIGDIEVRGNENLESNQVEIDIILSRGGDIISADNPNYDLFVKNLDLKIEKTGNKVSISAKDKRTFSNTHVSLSSKDNKVLAYGEEKTSFFDFFSREKNLLTIASFNVKLPKKLSRVNVKVTSGNITLNDFNGDANLQVISGGDILVQNAEGNVEAESKSGNIKLYGCINNIKATTTNFIDAVLEKGFKDVVLNNDTGYVNCKFPEDSSLDLNIKGRNVKIGSFDNFQGKKMNNKIEGKLNEGGNHLYINSKGNVFIEPLVVLNSVN